MEKLKIGPEREQLKSFDLMAPIDLMRYDYAVFGEVQAETRQRNQDECLTYIAEGVNRPLHTVFVLKSVDGNLSYFDRGQWRPYSSMLITGIEVAKNEAITDPRKQFQLDRAVNDWLVAERFEKLDPRERLTWYSPYPEKEEKLYGREFITSLGYSPQRKMGFLYQAIKNQDGSLSLHTQSVDNSDEEAFAAAMDLSSSNDQADIHDVLGAYDDVLALKQSTKVHAGRRLGLGIAEENAWEMINHHQDLLTFYFGELENISKDNSSSRKDLENKVKKLTYGVWAALKDRMDKKSLHISSVTSTSPHTAQLLLQIEVNRAYRTFSARGEVMSGCGGGIKGLNDDPLMEAESSNVFDSIFGNEEDQYGSLTFKCEKGHNNRRPRNKLIDNCKTCGVSVKC